MATGQKSSYFIPKKTSNSGVDPKKATPATTTTAAQTVLNIPGTRTSLQNNQLLTPIGIPSIDSFIGGGLPVGSVILIGQDKNNSFADIITRCFLGRHIKLNWFCN